MESDFRKKILLGRTELSVSRLGIAHGYGPESSSIEKAFHEYGVNYFVMGDRKNKGIVQAIKNLSPNHRENLVICYQTLGPFAWPLKWQTKRILKKLGLDYIDVLIMSGVNKKPSKRLVDTARKLQESGQVRFVGMSGHQRKAFGALAQDPDNPIDVFMLRYNAVHSGAEKDIFPYLKKDSHPGVTTFTATCWRKLLNPKKMPEGEKPLSARDCYRFVLSNPNVDVCLTGPSNKEQLQDNLLALEDGPLRPDEMDRIRNIGAFIYGK